MKTHRATVTWLSSEEGGRSEIPNGKRYMTIAKFPSDSTDWPNGAWTVVLDFDRPPSELGNPSIGTARFLMDTAPEAELRSGATFELYEGLRKVAIVSLS
jgi:hypothetical protein